MLGVPWGSDQELIPGQGRGVWPSRLAPPVGMSPGMSCWHGVEEEAPHPSGAAAKGPRGSH